MAIEVYVQTTQAAQVPKEFIKPIQVPKESKLDNVDPGAQTLTVEYASTEEQSTKSQLSEIQDKVAQLNDHVQNLARSLQFTIDDRSGSEVITVTDTETDEVIRQFPSEEVLKSRSAMDQLKGLLLETKA